MELKMHTLPEYDDDVYFTDKGHGYLLSEGDLYRKDLRCRNQDGYTRVERPTARHRNAVVHGVVQEKFGLNLPDKCTVQAFATDLFTAANNKYLLKSKDRSMLYGIYVIGDDSQFVLQAYKTGSWGNRDNVEVYEHRRILLPMKPIRQDITDRMDVFQAMVEWMEGHW